MKARFQPRPLLIAERFRFYQRSQVAGESVQDFIADLCRLAISCEFGDFLSQALRDRYVCGLKAENIQKKLLAEDNLTIAQALELARGMEVAAADAKELKHSSSVPGGKILHASNSGPPANAVCLSCGKSDHNGRVCRYRDAKCHACGKPGHITAGSKQGGNHKGHQGSPRARKTHQVVSAQRQGAEEDSELGILTVNDSLAKPITVDMMVSGH